MPNIVMADQPSGGFQDGISGLSLSRIMVGTIQGVPQEYTLTGGDVIVDFPTKIIYTSLFFNGISRPSGMSKAKLVFNCIAITQIASYNNNFLYNCDVFEEVIFNCSSTTFAGVPIGNHGLSGTSCAVKKISGMPIGLQKSTVNGAYRMFANNTIIEDVRFYENASPQTINFQEASKFNNDTLISLANGLEVSTGSATLKLHSTPKNRLASIIGAVESVTRNEETYDRFVADDNGTVTLQDFITTTKGWTLT